MSKYFGTDGFRGEANETLTAEHAYKTGRFIGWYYGLKRADGRAKVVIGKDTRRSSYMFEYALAAGLTASGADACLLHVTTTPSVSYVVRTEDFDCGIMISASHNPYYDNGIKLINYYGEKMEEDTILKVEAYLDGITGEIPFAKGEKIGRTVDYAIGRNRYIGYLISLATRSYEGLKVGLDCANGSAWMIAKNVFDTLGARTYVIHNNPDGININQGCGSTHIENLQKFVKEKGLDVGFAYDGDADRCLAVDENGNVVDGDLILYICGKYMKEQGLLRNNKIVTTVMSNLGFHKALDREGINKAVTAVGDRYVVEEMRKNGYNLGGEQSGHVIIMDYNTTGDGQLTAIQLTKVMVETGKSLSELASEVTIYPQKLVNIRVENSMKDKAMEVPAIAAIIEKMEAEMAGNGRILVRPSGTEPLLRVMAEAPTDDEVNYYVDTIADVVRAEIGLD